MKQLQMLGLLAVVDSKHPGLWSGMIGLRVTQNDVMPTVHDTEWT